MTINFNYNMSEATDILLGYDQGDLTSVFYDFRTRSYKYNKDFFFDFLFDLVNYDFISLQDHKVNVEESNHPELAEIVKRYATQEQINDVYERVYNYQPMPGYLLG